MTRAERIIRFIETYLRTPEGAHVGEPIRLAEFQKRFLVEVFDNPAGTNCLFAAPGMRADGRAAGRWARSGSAPYLRTWTLDLRRSGFGVPRSMFRVPRSAFDVPRSTFDVRRSRCPSSSRR